MNSVNKKLMMFFLLCSLLSMIVFAASEHEKLPIKDHGEDMHFLPGSSDDGNYGSGVDSVKHDGEYICVPSAEAIFREWARNFYPCFLILHDAPQKCKETDTVHRKNLEKGKDLSRESEDGKSGIVGGDTADGGTDVERDKKTVEHVKRSASAGRKRFYKYELNRIDTKYIIPPVIEEFGLGEDEKDISEEKFRNSVLRITNTLRRQPGIIEINGYTAIVGDVHGDFRTLEKIIAILSRSIVAGEIDHVLFLGDILDRGPSSTRTLNSLIKFFYKYRGHVHLIRGNHETMESYENGYYKCYAVWEPMFQKLGREVIRNFFDSIPYAAIINKNTLAIHGGIPHVRYWHEFWEGKKIPESDVKKFAVIRGALWSDYDELGDGITANYGRGFEPDSEVVLYNEHVVEKFFLAVNGRSMSDLTYCPKYCLSYLIRGHQIFNAPFCQSPNGVVTTVFSALNGQEPSVVRGGAGVAISLPMGLKPLPYLVLPRD